MKRIRTIMSVIIKLTALACFIYAIISPNGELNHVILGWILILVGEINDIKGYK